MTTNFGTTDMSFNGGPLKLGDKTIEKTGISIFDPVLCEIAYRWFSNKESIILDPFAGGSVRGIVANKIGRNYVGIELRKEQVEANTEQGKRLCPNNEPLWINGDSCEMDALLEKDFKCDLVFSCPPYADLEVYSDDPKDLSNMEYDEFLKAYKTIIQKAVNKLNDNRFIVWVIGEVRDKKGNYYNFVGDTISSFLEAGAKYYNECILLNSAGTLPLRSGKIFLSGRKVGKMHQNVLVFLKGDAKKATEYCGEIEINLEELS